MLQFHQYQVVGRALPTEGDEHPKIYRMKLWATNEVRAKSKFWYEFLVLTSSTAFLFSWKKLLSLTHKKVDPLLAYIVFPICGIRAAVRP